MMHTVRVSREREVDDQVHVRTRIKASSRRIDRDRADT